MRADSMATQMVTFPSSMTLPEPGQSLTLGSMTWIINANDNEEIVEIMQDNLAPCMLAPIAPVLAPQALISALR